MGAVVTKSFQIPIRLDDRLRGVREWLGIKSDHELLRAALLEYLRARESEINGSDDF